MRVYFDYKGVSLYFHKNDHPKKITCQILIDKMYSIINVFLNIT